ncbi:Sec1-like protein [Backusella circina FSU 941]|nr:Sec1-like protein [Backusella circina FSU 941]
MIGIDEILKKRFLELIKSVQPTGRWKLVIVDSLSSKILTSVCKMYDVLEESVSLLVENIEKPRQAYPTYEAVYILTPCIDSCKRLVDDFSLKGGPMYAAGHVHFINGLDNNVFTELTERLRQANASQYIKSLKEMYVDFIVREHSVFTLDEERKFNMLFGKDQLNDQPYINVQLDDIAKQLLCLCVTLGENPLIRYHRPLDIHGTINRRIPERLAKMVQDELDNFCKVNPEFPPPRDPPLPNGTLILLDRTIDPISPFLHEFTYQAMMADLLTLEEIPAGLKYEYEYTQEDGTTQKQEVTLTEQDTVYTTYRHSHIAILTEKLTEDFNKFMAQNKMATGTASIGSLNEMKNIISNLPQFQEMKSKYSAHMTIASDCMTQFSDQKLETLGMLEQDMACGETCDSSPLTDLVDKLIEAVDDANTSDLVKVRLILLWIATSDKVDQEELQELLSHARLSQDHKDAIENIALLGVQLSKTANKQGQKTKKNRKPSLKKQEVPFDLSRYVPVGHITRTIDNSLFPNLRAARASSIKKNKAEEQKTISQLRVYKTLWHKKNTGAAAGPKPPSGPPVIIFVVGGVTYSEIRSAYELSEAYDCEVYIGSTHIITPDRFVQDISMLDKVCPPPKSPVPAYINSVHRPLSSKSKKNDGLLSPSTSTKSHRLLGKW